MWDKHILVAEDEPHTRSSLNLLLKRAGYCVSMAPDGGRALDLLENDKSFDMLLTDIQMPEMNGIELLRNLRKKNISLPVIVFTGYGDKETVVELLREGCLEYLDKPFKENDLLERIDKVFSLVSSKQQTTNDLNFKLRNLQHKINKYKDSFEALTGSVDSIVDAYHKIIDTPLKSDKFNVAAESIAFEEVACDFSAVHDFSAGTDLFVADISSHDFGASYHAAMLKSFFEENCRLGHSGEDFLQVLNWQLIHTGHNQNMVTGLHLRLDLDKMSGEAVSAAHPYLFILKADTSALIRPFSSHSGSVLGLMEKASFEQRRFSISPGDRLILYSDGASRVSRMSLQIGKRETLGDLGVRDILKKNIRYPLNLLLKRSMSDIMTFSDCKYNDDILLLGVEVPGAEKA